MRIHRRGIRACSLGMLLLGAVPHVRAQDPAAVIEASNVLFQPLLDEKGALLSTGVGRVEILLGDEVQTSGGLSEDGYFALGPLRAETSSYLPCTVHVWDRRLGATYREVEAQGHGFAEAVFDLFVSDGAPRFGQQGFPGLQLQRAPDPEPPSLPDAVAVLGEPPIRQSWVTSAIVRTPGHGYGSALATVTFNGGGGSGASGRTILSNGVVVGVRILATGTSYTQPPTLQIPPPAKVPSVSAQVSEWAASLGVVPGYDYQLQATPRGTERWTNLAQPFLADANRMTRPIPTSRDALEFRVVRTNLAPEVESLSSKAILSMSNFGGPLVLDESGQPLSKDVGRVEILLHNTVIAAGPLKSDGKFHFGSFNFGYNGFVPLVVRVWDSNVGATFDDAVRAGHGYGTAALEALSFVEAGPNLAVSGFPGIQLLQRPDSAPIVQAAGIADINGSGAAPVFITNPGSGYGTTLSPIRFLGGGGTGAYATTILSNGVVVGATLLARGSGYTNTPTLLIAPPPYAESLQLEPRRMAFSITLDVGYTYRIELSSDGGKSWTSLGNDFSARDSQVIEELELSNAAMLVRVLLIN